MVLLRQRTGRPAEMPSERADLVEIVEHRLDCGKYVDAVRDPSAGAVVTFHGTTRDTFENQKVVELQYEAYAPMAALQLHKICRQARKSWALVGVAVAHRVGVVPVGEESVFIAVSSVHRKDALEACQFVIDQLKSSAPIWKKEIYEGGSAWKQNPEFHLANDRRCCSKPNGHLSEHGVEAGEEGPGFGAVAAAQQRNV